MKADSQLAIGLLLTNVCRNMAHTMQDPFHIQLTVYGDGLIGALAKKITKILRSWGKQSVKQF